MRIDKDDSSRNIVSKLINYMEESGICFRKIDLLDTSPYAILSSETSIGYRKKPRNWNKTGIVFMCVDLDAQNLSKGLSLPIDINNDRKRPNAVFVPDNLFEKAVDILKMNPENTLNGATNNVHQTGDATHRKKKYTDSYFYNSNTSDYRFISFLNDRHNVRLIRKNDGKLYVEKVYDTYNRSVFDQLKSVNLPGIPKITEIRELDNKLYTAEEYIEGNDLKKTLETRGVLSEIQVRDIAKQLFAILKRLHKLNPPILHRDIKPSNVILSELGKVYLVDFNASKKYNTTQNEDTVLFGTQFFAAPEQLLGYGASTPATDIYGLGATLNYLLTGAYPQQAIYPGKYRYIISRCIKMDPTARYQSIEEFEEYFDKA